MFVKHHVSCMQENQFIHVNLSWTLDEQMHVIFCDGLSFSFTAFRYSRHEVFDGRRADHKLPADADTGAQEIGHGHHARGGAPLLPQLPVPVGRSHQRNHRVRQEHPGIRQPGSERPSDAPEVRRHRSNHHHDVTPHEQRWHAGLLRPDLHDPRVPQEPAQALL